MELRRRNIPIGGFQRKKMWVSPAKWGIQRAEMGSCQIETVIYLPETMLVILWENRLNKCGIPGIHVCRRVNAKWAHEMMRTYMKGQTS